MSSQRAKPFCMLFIFAVKKPIKVHACAFDQKIETGCLSGNDLFSKELLVRIS